MATVNLLPSSTIINNWTISTGTAHECLQDDHTGFASGDSSNLSATAVNKLCVLQFDDFTEDHSSIDGIQIVTRAGNNGRRQSFELETKLRPASGMTSYYTEGSGTQLASAGYRTQTYTNRTTTDGSTAWNNTLVDGLRVNIKLDAHSGGTTRFTQVYIIATYTEPLATDNAVFFGTNF